jgi:hypothetical protein
MRDRLFGVGQFTIETLRLYWRFLAVDDGRRIAV